MRSGGGSGGFGFERLDMALEGLTGYVVSEIPRREDAHAEAAAARSADPGRAQRVTALVAAYHSGVAEGRARPIAFGWVRRRLAVRCRSSLPGTRWSAARTPRRRGAPGAAGRGARHGAAAGAGRLPEGSAAGGRSPGSATGCSRRTSRGRRAAGQRAALPLDEGLLGSWTGPFGWLVIAEPVTPGRAAGAAGGCRVAAAAAEAAADRFPEQAALARRLRERHAEFQRGESAGFWRITILAGGTDEASAARVAGLLCASADLGGLPYALSPAPAAPQPGRASRPRPLAGTAAPSSPFYGSTELLAALARPPEAEVPGVRLALRPEFDVTPEVAAQAEPGVELGERPGQEPHARRPVHAVGRVAQPARVRLRRDRRGQVADRPVPARGRDRARHPVAGGRAGQGRVPADGRAGCPAPR